MADQSTVRYRLFLKLAALAKAWEALWPRLWPAACLAGTFIALSLFDVLPLLPSWLHAGVLILFAAGFVLGLVFAFRRFRPIPRALARARLERDSGFQHQPLLAMEDTLAAGQGDPVAEAFWQRHKNDRSRSVDGLSLDFPNSDLARHEPWGVRAVVVLACAAGLMVGGSEAADRFGRAVSPGFSDQRATVTTVELWITPPDYTRRAPVFLRHVSTDEPAGTDGGPVLVAAGSNITAHATGSISPPSLRTNGQATPFETMESGLSAHRTEVEISTGTQIVVEEGGDVLASWDIEIIHDAAPNVTFASPIGAQGNGLLRIDFEATDDYGIDVVDAIVKPDDTSDSGQDARSLGFSLPLSTTSPTDVSGSAVQDLTPHEWAGKPVVIQLQATDFAQQTGLSDPVVTVLPERHFTHPVAQAIINERKKLFGDVAATVRQETAAALDKIARRPDFFANSIPVSLALAISKARLLHDRSADALASVRSLLWDTALKLEEGDVPFAERRLSQARQQLWEALRDGAGDAEIERLMDALQQALDEYLAAVAAELARRDQTAPLQQMPADAVRSEDLQRMLDIARQMARSGARDSAKQLLSELKNMLDGIRQGLDAGTAGRELREAQRLMDAVNELAQRQQQLLDQTFQELRRQRGAEPPQGGAGQLQDPADIARAQQELRQGLGDLMLEFDQFLGGIPDPLGDAERAMAGAGKELEEGRLGTAVPSQGAAIESLQAAREAARQALAQRLGGLFGMMGSNGEDTEGNDSDAFGRPSENGQRGFGVGSVRIPDGDGVIRAEEIIDELRNRAADRHRRTEELDYIERLLRFY